MSEPPYDPRAVANLLLDMAAAEDPSVLISNLVLQKLLYFAHGHFLIRNSIPLVKGAFEAWRYGPVHPAVYQAFKGEGEKPIGLNTRAVARNPMTGMTIPLPAITDPNVKRQLRDILTAYGSLSAGRLVEISHAPRGPWATIVSKATSSVALAMRIPDSVTIECFKHQKVTIGPYSRVGEPSEDEPLAGDRFG